jgi:NADH:ubiquinone oxidoreductase subunit F (NADH-binding)
MSSPPDHFLLPNSAFRTYADYLSVKGESAVARARARSPEEIVAELTRSGLRGRGGAGFSTGAKWRSLLTHPCSTKYVVCNAAEGEPGTFKDRYLLRMNPYAVLEGLFIAAHVLSAAAIYIAVKGSFREEIARLRAAIDEMRAASPVPMEIVEGPEEYLFGEEKALLNVIEGLGPLPRDPDCPPYEIGLFATPTSPNPALINNAETYAHVASIVRHGADTFRRDGTADTPGTVLYTISGDVTRPGVYERPAGITLRELIFDVAGGLGAGRTVKMILSGVSTAVLGPDKLDTQADFGHLAAVGGGLGSAGFIVYDDRRHAARVAQSVTRFLYVESCNQCSACKMELGVASAALDELIAATEPTDAGERAAFAARHAPQANRCYLPVQASIIIPSLVRRLKDELTGPVEAPAMLIPKIIDYDDARHVFVYDERSPRKQPSWMYTDIAPAAARAVRPMQILLDQDVVAGFEAIESDSLAVRANDVLRGWLASRLQS